MFSDRDKFRNPPPPLGYVQTGEPTLKHNKPEYENDPMYILMQELIDAKVHEIPDITIYEEFIINPSSDDEIMTAVPAPKVVDTADITAEIDEPNHEEIMPAVPAPKVVDTADITAENDEPNHEEIMPAVPAPKGVDTADITAKNDEPNHEGQICLQTKKKKTTYKRKRSHPKKKNNYSSDSDSH